MTGARVAIVGPGRVGSVLATALSRARYRVVAVAGGSEAARARVAGRVGGARPVADPVAAARPADLILVTTPDDAIEGTVRALAAADAVGEGDRVVHCSGALGLGPLRPAVLAGAGVAAAHPAQTITADADPDVLVGVAWGVTAPPADRGWAHALVADLGGDAIGIPDDRRVLYHAGLTVGSNGVAAAVAVARRLLLAARVEDPARFLAALVDTSTANVLERGADALTGPVVRGDVGTLASHIDHLATDAPALAAAYRALGAVVLDQVAAALPADRRRAVAEVLGTEDRWSG